VRAFTSGQLHEIVITPCWILLEDEKSNRVDVKPEAIRNSQTSQALVLVLILLCLIFFTCQGPYYLVTMYPPSASSHQSSRTSLEPLAGASRYNLVLIERIVKQIMGYSSY
jgi:hypothetical protein